MKRNFTSRGLRVGVSQKNDTLSLIIESDYSRSQHKGRLYVDAKALAETVERFWKSIKTKKLKSVHVSFGEIDWYDDMTDMYTTPSVGIQRGLKKARIHQFEHGSIPKDWAFQFQAEFSETTTSTPFIEVIKAALGTLFTPKMEKNFRKLIKGVLQKKEKYISVYGEDED